jgi:putative FmdB family regulatory protein
MPTYEYECTKCQDRFEDSMPVEERDLPTEVECGCCFQEGSVRRIWQANPAHFKGKGFYATDK